MPLADVVRRYYVFGLRDEIPAPEQPWTVYRHPADCSGPTGLTCGGAECDRADVCRIIPLEGSDQQFAASMGDLAWVISDMTGTSGPDLPVDPVPRRRMVAVVGSPLLPGNVDEAHVHHCLDLLRDAAKALRHASQAHTFDVTLERLWPIYAIVDEHRDGSGKVTNLVLIENGFRTLKVVTAHEARLAERHLLAAWQCSPVEMYQDFELGARRAAATYGDYADAVLKAATATETLLKHAAWLLTWEATTVLTADPCPQAATACFAGDAGKPRTLVGSVLSPRLRGSWDSRDVAKPVGAWRHSVAQVRNSVIHRGYRPTSAQAYAAVAAMDRLEQLVVDRVASMAAAYPRTALLIAGRDGLERRGAFGKAPRAVFETESLSRLLVTYLSWLDDRVSDDAD